MARTRNTADLLLNVSARVARPAADGLLSDAELLDRIDEEMRSEMAALLVSARSEWWITTYSIAITSGTSAYRIPDRAIGLTLRDVIIVDSGDREWNASIVAEEDRNIFAGTALTPGQSPYSFALESAKITLIPAPTDSIYTLKMRYIGRPSRLVETTAAAPIDSAGSTTTLTLDVTPTPPTTVTTTGALVDIVRGDGMFEVLSQDNTVSSFASPTITLGTAFTQADVATSTVQNQRVDYLCPAGQTVYPPIPDVLWPALVSLGCRVYCEAIKDTSGMRLHHDVYMRHLDNARGMLMPRVAGETSKPVGRWSPLRAGRW